MPSLREAIPETFRTLRNAREAARDHASLHRGLLLVAPVFWGAFAVFLHPVYAAAGFLAHAALCLPRGRRAKRPGHAALPLAFLLAFPLMALWFAAREPYATLPDAPFHRDVIAESEARARRGVVRGDASPTPSGWTVLIQETSGEQLVLRATLSTAKPPRRAATIRVTGVATPASPPPNPGQFDLRHVLRAQGAAATLRADAWEEIRPPPAWARAQAKAHDALRQSLDRNVPPAALALPEAALLNVTDGISKDTRDAFLRSGMQHVLAISGQHIGILIAFLLAATRGARVPRKAAFALAGLLTLAYIPLVGSPVSVVRSGITFACLLPAVMTERRTSGLHALCLTATIDLLFDPHNILNLGFQLSYAATLALVIGAGPLQRAAAGFVGGLAPARSSARGARRVVRWIARATATAMHMILLSAFIALFTYPVLAASTHATTPWGVLGNLAAAPAGAAMLVGGLFTWSFDFLLPHPLDATAQWAGAVTGLCALLLEGCVTWLSTLPGALRPIADAPDAWLATLVAGCAAVAALARFDRFRAAALCAAILLAAEGARPLLSRPGAGEARVTFLAVGHGDAAVLEMPGAVLLIDAGDSPRVARNVIAPFLRFRGIDHVDMAMVTHPDLDHFGGMAALTHLVRVERFIGPPVAAESSGSWRCLQRAVRARRIPWREGRGGQRIHAGGNIAVWLLGPDSTLDGADKNDRSLVALLRTPATSVLFTGDIEGPGQRALASSWPLWRGAWMKAPHHGSDRTTLSCFPAAVKAPRATISCGGRRGFPGPRTLDALAEAGTTIAITRQAGAVTWTFDRRGGGEMRYLAPN